jgi:hypothetical protein
MRNNASVGDIGSIVIHPSTSSTAVSSACSLSV